LLCHGTVCVVGKMRDLILQLSKSSIYSTKPLPVHENRLWALISALVIEESSRGSGIGQQLLHAAERLARDKQCAHIELSSSEKRIRAHQFYENNGYKEVRKRFVKHLS
ncbi:GNAT family N-acetyltransferase, partial [Klebsiella pneumoniae]